MFAIEALANPRLRDEVGELQLVPPEERVSGPGATPVMAAFTHLNPEGSRFSDGSYGVYYAAHSLATAVAEVSHHRTVFLRRTDEPAIDLDMRLITANVEAELHDLRIAGERAAGGAALCLGARPAGLRRVAAARRRPEAPGPAGASAIRACAMPRASASRSSGRGHCAMRRSALHIAPALGRRADHALVREAFAAPVGAALNRDVASPRGGDAIAYKCANSLQQCPFPAATLAAPVPCREKFVSKMANRSRKNGRKRSILLGMAHAFLPGSIPSVASALSRKAVPLLHMLLVFGHLLAASMALGAIVATDLRLLSKLSQDKVRIAPPNPFVARIVMLALLLLYVTGGAIVIQGLGERADYLDNPKLQAKIALVVVLTLNAFVLHYVTFPRLARGRRVPRWNVVDWIVVAVPVATSNFLWMFSPSSASPGHGTTPRRCATSSRSPPALFLVVQFGVFTILATAGRNVRPDHRGWADRLARSLAAVGSLGRGELLDDAARSSSRHRRSREEAANASRPGAVAAARFRARFPGSDASDPSPRGPPARAPGRRSTR